MTSAHQWFPNLPGNWEIARLGACFEQVRETVNEELGIVTVFRDGEVTLRSNRRSEGYTEATDYSLYQVIKPGHLAIHNMDAFAGAVGVSDSHGMCSPVVTVCRPKTNVNAKYFSWVLREMARSGWIEANAKSVRERTSEFRWPMAKSQLVPLPPRDEQDAIVEYLDSEIIKLEEMISRLANIIAVAKERRQSLIQKSISVGLTSGNLVETKISWIPQIPAHWRMIKLRYLVSSFIGLTYSPDEITVDEAMPLVLRAGNVKNGKLDLSDELRVTTPIPRDLMLKDGDILVCARSGSKALVGKSAYVENLKTPATFGAFMTVLRSPLGKYLYWVMNSELLPYQMGRFDSVTINQLTNSTLLDFEIPVPDQTSMQEISDYLDRETAIIDRQIDLSENLMALTQARRESLISAAVTGKIDVLGVVNG